MGGPGRPPGYAVLPIVLATGALCLTVGCGEETVSTGGRKPRALQEVVHAPFAARLELPLDGHKITGALAIDADGDGSDELVEVSRVPGGLYHWDRLRGGFDAENTPGGCPLGGYGLGPVAFDATRPALVAAASQETGSVHLFDLSQERGEKVLWIRELGATPTALAAGRLEGSERPVLAVITEAEEVHLFDESGEAKVHALASRDGDYPTVLHFLESGGGLIVGLQGRRGVEVYAAEGNGTLGAEPAHLVFLDGIPRDIDEADLDGDGDRELLIAGGDHALWVLGWGAPGGTLAALAAGVDRIVEWYGGAIPIGVEVANFDGDEALEVCVLGHYDLKVHVLDELTEHGPRSQTSMECGQAPWGLAVGDFNGDGHTDLATTNTDAYRSSLILGRGDGTFELVHRVGCARAPLAIATGDLDGDGYPEALALSAIDHGIDVLRSDRGYLREGEPIAGPPATDGLSTVDLDSDGHVDAVYLSATARGSELAVLFGDGQGNLVQREGFEPRPFGTGVGAIWCSDLNGDGAKDVVVSDPVAGRVVVFEGKGEAAGFRLANVRELTVEGGPAALSLLPAQGERPPRLCVGLESAGQEIGLALFDVLVQDGGRVHLEPSGSLPAKRRTGGVVCADFDGDSNVDLAFLGLGGGDVSPGEIFVWRSDDEGELHHFATLDTGLAPYMIVAADLNGDGRADLAANAQHSHQVSVWLSRTGEQPSPFLRLVDFGVGRGPLDLCATDMDLDGRIDLVVADNYNSSVSTLFNRISPEVTR